MYLVQVVLTGALLYIHANDILFRSSGSLHDDILHYDGEGD